MQLRNFGYEGAHPGPHQNKSRRRGEAVVDLPRCAQGCGGSSQGMLTAGQVPEAGEIQILGRSSPGCLGGGAESRDRKPAAARLDTEGVGGAALVLWIPRAANAEARCLRAAFRLKMRRPYFILSVHQEVAT